MRFSLLIAVIRCRKESLLSFLRFWREYIFLENVSCCFFFFSLFFKGLTLRRRSLRLFLLRSYPREKYFHRDINNLASCKGVKNREKCGWKEVIVIVLFFAWKIIFAKEASFRRRELDLKGKEKRKQRGGNKGKNYIFYFSTQANSINILRSLYYRRGSISN